MKNILKPFLFIFLAAAIIAVIMRPRGGGADIIPWRTDLTAAREEARMAHKPLLLEFSASWCGYCQQMSQTTWSDKAVATELGKMVPVKIDVDNHPELARQYGISPIPAYVILDSSGNVLKSDVGYKSPAEMIAWLNGKPSLASGD